MNLLTTKTLAATLGLLAVAAGCAAQRGADVASPASKQGAASAKSGTITIDLASGTGTAQFATTDEEGSWTQNTMGCSATMIAGCRLVSCKNNGDFGAQPNAGKIVVEGASSGRLVLTPADDVYGSNDAPTAFASGESLTVSADGADVPAFSTKIASPGVINVTTPSLDENTTFDASRDLPVAWTGASSGDVTVSLVAMPVDGGHFQKLTCTTSAANGKLAIAREALAKLDAAGANIGIVVQPTTSGAVLAGDFATTLRVTGKAAYGKLVASNE